jgi:membrane protein YdbS with pleckstrin-like domain
MSAKAAVAEKETKPKEEQLKSKHFKEQFDDEDTLLVFRKHPIVMRKGLILASFGMLIGPLFTLILTYTAKTNPPSMFFFFASIIGSFFLAMVLMFPWWVKWYFSVYIMTNQRFIQQSRSLLQVNVVDIGLEQIQMINYQIQGLEETLLHFGTIIVQTYAGDLVIHDVHHPEKVQKKLVHTLRELGVHPTQRPLNND